LATRATLSAINMSETVIKKRIRIKGPGARGARIDAALLRDLLDVLVDGCQQAVRLRIEGRSTAQGKTPAWLARAAAIEIVGLSPGSTVIALEVPALAEAVPERFGQADLFTPVDAGLTCLDLFEESLRDAMQGERRATPTTTV
jgi:hypothetical protein